MSAPREPVSAGRMQPSWLANQGKLPLAFMALGSLWLVVAAALSALHPQLLAQSHLHPGVIALTHAWVLGFFVTVACGAICQLAPVALSTTLWSERAGWAQFWLHALGVPGMVWGFWRWNLHVVGTASLLVVVGVLVFSANTWLTVRQSRRTDPVAASLLLAPAWLTLTVLAGLTLALNRARFFLPADPVALLRAHAHLGLLGFFGTLLQGVTFRLIPMFTLGDVPDWRRVKAGLWCTQLGLLVLAPALALHVPVLSVAAGAVIVVGFACSGYALVRTLGTRKKRLLDLGVKAFLAGLVALAIAAVAGVLLAHPRVPGGSAAGGFGATSYGLLILVGGLLPVIGGMMCKIVPFLVWMRAYGPRVGRGPTPPAGTLARPWLHRIGLLLQFIATVALIGGAWLLDERLLRTGGVLLAGGASLLAADIAGVLRHLWFPQTGPAPTPGAFHPKPFSP